MGRNVFLNPTFVLELQREGSIDKFSNIFQLQLSDDASDGCATGGGRRRVVEELGQRDRENSRSVWRYPEETKALGDVSWFEAVGLSHMIQ